MNKNFAYGLGWQPDLPDLRDKKFSRACEHANVPPVAPAAKNAVAATTDPSRVITHEAWRASSQISVAVRSRLKSRSAPTEKRYAAAHRQAFEGNPGQPTVGENEFVQRPLLLELPPAREQLPSRVDLRRFMSPIEDQGQLGSCTAQAMMGLVEYLQIATQGEYVDGSRLFLYKATRDLLEWTGDTGAYLRETVKALRLFGVCPERYLPYDIARFNEEPASFCYAFAANLKSISYYRLSNLTEIKQSLAQGYPVAFGFTCFESLGLPQVKASGVIPYPFFKERSVGGHAILAVGYQDKGSASKPAQADCLIIRNSWGNNWGEGGYGYLPYDYIPGAEGGAEPLADDFWTITRMEFPELSDSQAPPFALGDGGNDPQGGSDGNDPQGGNEGGGVQRVRF